MISYYTDIQYMLILTKISYKMFAQKCSSDDGSNGPIILQYMPLIGQTLYPYSTLLI